MDTSDAPLERSRGRPDTADPVATAVIRDLEVDEVWASMRFAGGPLDRAEVEALVRRGVAVGGHRLDAYVAVADYADAARFVREARPPSRRRGYVSVAEIVALHLRAARRSGLPAGAFREHSLAPFPDGMVPPPAWLLPQTVAAFAERFQAGPAPGASRLAWVAAAHHGYERIHPFDGANGRVGRLLVNLLLRRLGYPPFIVRPKDAPAYLRALRRADAGDLRPLERLLARCLRHTSEMIAAHVPHAADVKPLAQFASGRDRAALYKAAQRGRLRTVRRAGRLYTTQAWIAAYRAAQERPAPRASGPA